MNLYDRFRKALEEWYERWDEALDVWLAEDDICTAPIPYELTGKAKAA